MPRRASPPKCRNTRPSSLPHSLCVDRRGVDEPAYGVRVRMALTLELAGEAMGTFVLFGFRWDDPSLNADLTPGMGLC